MAGVADLVAGDGPVKPAAANRYLADRVMTATPEQLVGMLYDVTVRSLVAGGTALAEGDRPTASQHLLKAQDAVGELRCSLDLSAGQLATSLDALYAYAYVRIVRGMVQGDQAAVAEVLTIMQELREAWRQACLQPAPSAPAALAASR